MCTPESNYPCRRKWRLRPFNSHTAAPNARGRFRLDADWRCTKLAGAALDSALPPDGSEAWMLTPRALAMLNGFNSWQLHGTTGRSYREEAITPLYDLLKAVRTRRHQWLGHILRMHSDRLVRRAVLALGQQTGAPYQPGSPSTLPLSELIMRSADRRGWARYSRSLRGNNLKEHETQQ